MRLEQELHDDLPLYISRSRITTEVNKTGAWRYVRPGYDEKTAPCSRACPAGEDIARIEMLAGQGMVHAAWETLLRENPFPAICGRVCFHPCESACNRQEMDQSIAVHHLERFIGDTAIRERFEAPHPFYGDEAEQARRKAAGKRIAIAGAGPAGLSAAYFLTRLGHACDVYDADDEPGGVLRWGIPWYRLPEDVLKIELSRLLDMGVRILCNQPVTRDFLKTAADRYDGIFLGCGYGRSLRMGIPGEERVRDGLEFLHQVRSGEDACLQGTAAVIGGGNTAVDVARTLVRMGVRTTIVYRRRRSDMPAFDHEVEMALEEGITLVEQVAPIQIEAAENEYRLILQEMKTSDMDTRTGRVRVVPDGDKTRTMRFDQVFSAIGAEPGENWLIPPEDSEKVLSLSHCVLQEGKPTLVFGGDLATPVKSVADAVGSGKQAAMILDTYFNQGRDAIPRRLADCRVGHGQALSMEIYLGGKRRERNPHEVRFLEINTDYFSPAERQHPPVLHPPERVNAFEEVEGVLSRESAIMEAARCFNCGICNECDNCRLYCPELAVYIDGARCINFDYCKGCGICVVECPRNAMSLKEEGP